MTELIAELVALAKADTGVASEFMDRLYPDSLPDAATFPAAVFTKVSGVEAYVLAGRTDIETARVQVDVYADRGYSAMTAARKTLRDLLSGYRGATPNRACAIDSCRLINDTDLPTPATERSGPRLRRRVLEFIIWHKVL